MDAKKLCLLKTDDWVEKVFRCSNIIEGIYIGKK
jgi:hypothetical protein